MIPTWFDDRRRACARSVGRPGCSSRGAALTTHSASLLSLAREPAPRSRPCCSSELGNRAVRSLRARRTDATAPEAVEYAFMSPLEQRRAAPGGTRSVSTDRGAMSRAIVEGCAPRGFAAAGHCTTFSRKAGGGAREQGRKGELGERKGRADRSDPAAERPSRSRLHPVAAPPPPPRFPRPVPSLGMPRRTEGLPIDTTVKYHSTTMLL